MAAPNPRLVVVLRTARTTVYFLILFLFVLSLFRVSTIVPSYSWVRSKEGIKKWGLTQNESAPF